MLARNHLEFLFLNDANLYFLLLMYANWCYLFLLTKKIKVKFERCQHLGAFCARHSFTAHCVRA